MSGTTVRRSPGRKGTPQAEPKSKLPQTVPEVLDKHVVLEVESIDRMYCNVIVRRLQILEGALRFIRQQRKAKVLSTNAGERMKRAFVQAIERFAEQNQIPMASFRKRPAQRRGRRRTAGEIPTPRRRGFHRQGAGEAPRLSHREAAQQSIDFVDG